MKYVYPLLSEHDYFFFRSGGAGLGNILFAYARAVVYAKNNNCIIIWPTWPSLKIGPIVRGEKDKRFYTDLFTNNSGYISGLSKILLLLTKPKVAEKVALDGGDTEEKIIEFTGFDDLFEPILADSALVRDDLLKNLKKKNRSAVNFQADKAICMHVRLGDFKRATWEEVLQGNHDCSIPIEWYVQMGKELRRITGAETKIWVFSDGTDEELKPLLSLSNTERKTFGTAIGDLVALSKAGVFIASGSSFSMWARYLGRMTTIMFPNQVKEKILLDHEAAKEIVAVEKIDDQYRQIIRDTLL